MHTLNSNMYTHSHTHSHTHTPQVIVEPTLFCIMIKRGVAWLTKERKPDTDSEMAEVKNPEHRGGRAASSNGDEEELRVESVESS